MGKFTAVLLLLALMLTGCGVLSPGPVESTLSVDEVATQVGVLLTAQPIPTLAPTTTIPPTSTLAPSMTPLPATPTVATATLPASTPTPVATTGDGAEGHAAGLGDPAWRNPFDSGKGFGLSEPYADENTRFEVRSGRLEMTGLKPNGWHGWRLTSPKIQNFYLEAAMTPQNCSGDDVYGIVFRAPDFESGRGYYFGVTCDGRYMFGKWQESSLADVISLTQHPAINSGSNQFNRLGVYAFDRKIELYVNGKLLTSLEDTTFTDAGNFGVWLAANDTTGFTVWVDEMSYWNP